MITLKTTLQFRKDYKLAKKRRCDMFLLEKVVQLLAEGQPLCYKHRDHALVGKYIGFRECHITPDWLLIYQMNNNVSVLTLSRMGTHADLFDG